jgi:hypothetical protein
LGWLQFCKLVPWGGFCELQLRIGLFGFDVTEQPWVMVWVRGFVLQVMVVN